MQSASTQYTPIYTPAPIHEGSSHSGTSASPVTPTWSSFLSFLSFPGPPGPGPRPGVSGARMWRWCVGVCGWYEDVLCTIWYIQLWICRDGYVLRCIQVGVVVYYCVDVLCYRGAEGPPSWSRDCRVRHISLIQIHCRAAIESI